MVALHKLPASTSLFIVPFLTSPSPSISTCLGSCFKAHPKVTSPIMSSQNFSF